MVARRSAQFEAFKQSIEKAQAKRFQDLHERSSLDAELSARLSELPLSEAQRDAAVRSLGAQQDRYLRESRRPVRLSDFALLKVIGAGAFGVVRLCRKKGTGEVFALKQMSKVEMVRKNKVRHVCNEKDAMSRAKNDWVVGLHCTFQDDAYLYMVMDYMPGGDLMTHLQRKGIFSEKETRFYIAELVQAVDYIHTALHYIHRDIKPDNVVLDARGHIRLVDFGLCTRDAPQAAAEGGFLAGPTLLGAQHGGGPKARCHPPRPQLRSLVGTPDYAAPEVYLLGPCCRECDFWSVGIIAYEMLFGRTPFSDDRHDPQVIMARVQRWRQYLRLPAAPCVGEEARDLVRGLVCDAKDRLTANQIRAHSFFKGLDFLKLREMEPPIKPVVRGPLDTSNFDDFSGEDLRFRTAPRNFQADAAEVAFHDYGYRRDLEAKRPSIAQALNCALGLPEAECAWPVKETPKPFMWLAELIVSTAIFVCSPRFGHATGGNQFKHVGV
mmetsp:Transcript_69419/g.192067  ORF Transcript_69419/g.192067 Transcript_69419/m.192067 type:complete len:495 (-) Transcript_69419:189-1673(-)